MDDIIKSTLGWILAGVLCLAMFVGLFDMADFVVEWVTAPHTAHEESGNDGYNR